MNADDDRRVGRSRLRVVTQKATRVLSMHVALRGRYVVATIVFPYGFDGKRFLETHPVRWEVGELTVDAAQVDYYPTQGRCDTVAAFIAPRGGQTFFEGVDWQQPSPQPPGEPFSQWAWCHYQTQRTRWVCARALTVCWNDLVSGVEIFSTRLVDPQILRGLPTSECPAPMRSPPGLREWIDEE